jgi:hypothetical protein
MNGPTVFDEHELIMATKVARVRLLEQGYITTAVAEAGRDKFETMRRLDKNKIEEFTVIHWRWHDTLGWFPFLIDGKRVAGDGLPFIKED